MSLSAIKRLRACRIRLLSQFPFFGHLAMHFTLHVEEDAALVPTAQVSANGCVRFGRAFLDTLSDAQLMGVLCHEILHVALFYWQRQGHRNVLLCSTHAGKKQYVPAWNVAHDYAINAIIQDVSNTTPAIQLPPNALLNTKYTNWQAERIYEDILQHTPDLTDFDGDIDMASSPAEDTRWKHAILQAASTHQQRGMSLPDSIRQVVSSACQPVVSWQDRLAQWVGETLGRIDYSYRRPSRRAESAGEILSAPFPHGAPPVIVLWDTSGSMCGAENALMAEALGILEASPAPIRVVTCDAIVRGDAPDVREAADIVQIVTGGGGSNLSPAFELIQPQLTPDTVIIVMTDGHVLVPPHAPMVQAVLWLLTPGGVDPTNGHWGEVIRMEDASS